MAFSVHKTDRIFLDILVDFRRRRRSLVDVIESLGEREVVRLPVFAIVVQQELADIFTIRRAIVIAKQGEPLPLAREPGAKLRTEIPAALRSAFHQRVDLLLDVRAGVDHAVEYLSGTRVEVVALAYRMGLNACLHVLVKIVWHPAHPGRFLHGAARRPVIGILFAMTPGVERNHGVHLEIPEKKDQPSAQIER